jgi:hypothetical protein
MADGRNMANAPKAKNVLNIKKKLSQEDLGDRIKANE